MPPIKITLEGIKMKQFFRLLIICVMLAVVFASPLMGQSLSSSTAGLFESDADNYLSPVNFEELQIEKVIGVLGYGNEGLLAGVGLRIGKRGYLGFSLDGNFLSLGGGEDENNKQESFSIKPNINLLIGSIIGGIAFNLDCSSVSSTTITDKATGEEDSSTKFSPPFQIMWGKSFKIRNTFLKPSIYFGILDSGGGSAPTFNSDYTAVESNGLSKSVFGLNIIYEFGNKHSVYVGTGFKPIGSGDRDDESKIEDDETVWVGDAGEMFLSLGYSKNTAVNEALSLGFGLDILLTSLDLEDKTMTRVDDTTVNTIDLGVDKYTIISPLAKFGITYHFIPNFSINAGAVLPVANYRSYEHTQGEGDPVADNTNWTFDLFKSPVFSFGGTLEITPNFIIDIGLSSDLDSRLMITLKK
jgi:hypothetical protein